MKEETKVYNNGGVYKPANTSDGKFVWITLEQLALFKLEKVAKVTSELRQMIWGVRKLPDGRYGVGKGLQEKDIEKAIKKIDEILAIHSNYTEYSDHFETEYNKCAMDNGVFVSSEELSNFKKRKMAVTLKQARARLQRENKEEGGK